MEIRETSHEFGSENLIVSGVLHRPADARDALLLTHGAGANCNAPLLQALARAIAEMGILVFRYDLPFRQTRRFGPPRPGDAALDRKGIAAAVQEMRRLVPGRVFAGGHSYGGRQTTMLAADEPGALDGLLLLSYPLHPPRRPEQMRTAHLPRLRTPALFAHGTRDPFGSPEEIRSALKLVPAETRLLLIEGAGHDLGFSGKKRNEAAVGQIVTEFLKFR